MYLGEIARLIILDFIESELIFVEEMKMVGSFLSFSLSLYI